MFFHQQSSAKYPAIPLLLRCATERAYKQKKHKLSEEILSSAKQISDSFGAAPSTFTAHRVSQIACFRSITAAIFVGMSYRFPPSYRFFRRHCSHFPSTLELPFQCECDVCHTSQRYIFFALSNRKWMVGSAQRTAWRVRM